MLITYVRDKNGHKIGAVVALVKDDTIRVGWSKCNKQDKFNKQMALMIASVRAKRATIDLPYGTKNAIPFCVRETFDSMTHRAKKYFKDKKNLAEPIARFAF
jgi:hypothetical protein